MEHPNCKYLLSSLSDYIDGELGSVLCTEIEQHIKGCENCRIVVDSLRKTVYLYKATAEAPGVPIDVRERLYKRLDLNEFLEKKK
jgi:predicted anti-sigma-YlaC factor YlaD